ncbi:MAG: hypothetical protein MJ077_11240 [Oscillospiraceae bacterium]|nr:hypothetical protein [Oscillospiraceae bacterium]
MEKYYRVRTAWTAPETQKGAFTDFNNAKSCCDKNSGSFVFTEDGIPVYPLPFLVTLTEPTEYFSDSARKNKAGMAAKGTYTINAVDTATGSGKLKSGAGYLNLSGLKVSRVAVQVSPLVRVQREIATVYDKVVALHCTHGGNATTFAQMQTQKKTTCGRTASFVLQRAGLLPEGKLISHTKAVGGNWGHITERKRSLGKCMTGLTALDRSKCSVNYVAAKSFSALPAKYKVKGAVYIQDSNVCICGGKANGKWTIYSCNEGKAQVDAKGRYVRNRNTSGYPFSSPILAVVLPKT